MSKTVKTLVVVGILIGIILVAYFTHPLRTTKPEKTLENKIKITETFRDEAQAMSVSLPVLSDSIIKIYSDSIQVTLTDLNKTWVMYVQTQEGFEKYTTVIGSLNESLEKLLIKYEIEKSIRMFRDVLKNMQKNIEKQKRSFGTNTYQL